MDYLSGISETLSRLVEMTEHDEPYRLKKTLIETIQQIIGELKIDMFEVIYSNGGYIQRNCLEPDQSFAPERRAAIIDACKHHGIQQFAGDLSHGRYAIPIRLDTVITEVLVVEGGELMVAEREVEAIANISRLYQNYITMLHRYEHDALTGLMNRHSFERQVNVLHQVQAYSYYLAMVDIDHFKRVNDTYGHLFGDDVLILIAKKLKEFFGAAHYRHLFRFGGEEFVVLLEGDDASSYDSLDQFRMLIEETDFPGVGQVTFSAGIAPINPEVPIVVSIDRADQALYEAKRAGRNRVLMSAPVLVEDEAIQEGDLTLF
jgi:diguanylate cyclase (GGDEF)-like protein